LSSAPRISGTRIPGPTNSDVANPGDFACPEEELFLDDLPVGDRRALDSINKAKNSNCIQRSVSNSRVVVERNLSHANTRTGTVRSAFLRSSFSVDDVAPPQNY
jgi:hypothetical protein